jgi:hypothetical protein
MQISYSLKFSKRFRTGKNINFESTWQWYAMARTLQQYNVFTKTDDKKNKLFIND